MLLDQIVVQLIKFLKHRFCKVVFKLHWRDILRAQNPHAQFFDNIFVLWPVPIKPGTAHQICFDDMLLEMIFYKFLYLFSDFYFVKWMQSSKNDFHTSIMWVDTTSQKKLLHFWSKFTRGMILCQFEAMILLLGSITGCQMYGLFLVVFELVTSGIQSSSCLKLLPEIQMNLGNHIFSLSCTVCKWFSYYHPSCCHDYTTIIDTYYTFVCYAAYQLYTSANYLTNAVFM